MSSSLLDFARKQEEFVREAGRKIAMMMGLNPAWDSEAAARRILRNSPILQGVSVNELLGEAVNPGSFRNR